MNSKFSFSWKRIFKEPLTILFVPVANDSDFVLVTGMGEGVDFPI